MDKLKEMLRQYDVSEEYVRNVERIIATKSKATVHNYSFGHAAYLSKRMFEETTRCARILTGELTPGDDPLIKNAFEQMVARLDEEGLDESIRVITTVDGGCPKWLKELARESSALSLIEAKVKVDHPAIRHTFSMDHRMYRIEEPHDAECDDVAAEVCFNDPAVAERVESAFDEVWNALNR